MFNFFMICAGFAMLALAVLMFSIAIHIKRDL